ncbi:MAG: hypothetical protein V9G11_07725 [Bifidobacterium adolescentis]
MRHHLLLDKVALADSDDDDVMQTAQDDPQGIREAGRSARRV